jgi:hypothetical protein
VATGVVESTAPDHGFVLIVTDAGARMHIAPWSAGGWFRTIRYIRAITQAKRAGDPEYEPDWSLRKTLQVGQRVEVVMVKRGFLLRSDNLEVRPAEQPSGVDT